jgi:hypothetical protein
LQKTAILSDYLLLAGFSQYLRLSKFDPRIVKSMIFSTNLIYSPVSTVFRGECGQREHQLGIVFLLALARHQPYLGADVDVKPDTHTMQGQ